MRLVLGLWYSLLTPLGESHDEWGHYSFAHYIARERTVQVPDGGLGVPMDESHQPPLYYVFVAALISSVRAGDDFAPIPDPHAFDLLSGVGPNAFVHTAREAFPYAGTVLAWRTARLLNLSLGLVTVAATYALALALFGGTKSAALIAAGIVAFSPQALFLGGTVTNDAAVASLSAPAFLALLAYGLRHSRAWGALAAGIALLAPLVKLTGVTLALVIWGRLVGLRGRRPQLAQMIILTTLLVAVSAWWAERQLNRLAAVGLATPGPAQRGLDLLHDPSVAVVRLTRLPDLARHTFLSFWGSFGWGNVGAPEWYYFPFLLITLLAGAGLLTALRHGHLHHAWLWRAVALLVILQPSIHYLVLLVILNEKLPFFQGRFLLPILPGVALLAALAWTRALPRLKGVDAALPLLPLIVLAVWVPAAILVPAYGTPSDFVGHLARPAAQMTTLGRAIGLMESQMPARVQVGRRLPATLYLVKLRPLEGLPSLHLRIKGLDHQVYGESWQLLGGRRPLFDWPLEAVLKQEVGIVVQRDTPLPVGSWLEARVVRVDSGEVFRPQEGTPAEGDGWVAIGRTSVWPREQSRAARSDADDRPLGTFGPGIGLLAHDLQSEGSLILLSLIWKSERRWDDDLTVFLHVVDMGGRILAQGDGPPLNRLLPTSFWTEGDVIHELRSVQLPPRERVAACAVLLGWYRLDTLERLPAWDGDGVPLPDHALRVPIPGSDCT